MRMTQRLVIRPLNLRDFQNWQQAYTMLKPAQNPWDESPWKESELTRAKYRQLLGQQQRSRKQDHSYSYGVFKKEDGVLIGFVDFMEVSRRRFQNAFLGYRIFNNYWGEGYASEACRGALDIAFKDLKLHRIEAGIAPENKLSLRVAKAIGLRKEGLSRKRLLVDGEWVDLLLYAGTCEDFGRKYKIK